LNAGADRLRAAATLTTAGRVTLFVGGALPWLLPFGRSYLRLGAVGAAIDLAFTPLCHRLTERTLVLAGVPMPLCSRCAGIFAGVALGAIFALPRIPLARWRAIIAATGALMLLDVVTQELGVHPIWHLSRVLTGALFGYAIAVAVITALRGEQRIADPLES
jgi:uncharacterized membrane protein